MSRLCEGVRQERIANRLGVSRERVNQAIGAEKAKYVLPSEGIPHPWLDPDDEANVHRTWVPTPDDLAAFYAEQKFKRECASIKRFEKRR